MIKYSNNIVIPKYSKGYPYAINSNLIILDSSKHIEFETTIYFEKTRL